MPSLAHPQILKALSIDTDLNRITGAIQDYLDYEDVPFPFLLAIDGRCAAGKTTLAHVLATLWDCNLVHSDDYYLPFSQRTASRLSRPGGHMNLERLRDEVLLPLVDAEKAVCRPYSCHDDRWLCSYPLDPTKPTIVEGSYTCHPSIQDLIDCKLFIDIDPTLQRARLLQRSPDTLNDFLDKWIPREETYFQTYDLRYHCDILIEGLI